MLGLRSHTVGLSRRNRRHGLAVEEVRPVAVVKHVSGVFPPLSSTSGDRSWSKRWDRSSSEPWFAYPLIKALAAGAYYPRTWWMPPDQGVLFRGISELGFEPFQVEIEPTLSP
jgi:hypothetical protein